VKPSRPRLLRIPRTLRHLSSFRSRAVSACLVLAVVVAFGCEARPASALDVGASAPPFDLAWLTEEGTIASTELFAQSPLTVLVIWNRGCPRCTKIALGAPAFADTLEPRGVRVVGILFGPDDPQGLKDLLWDHDVAVPHLWDPDARIAAAYGLGFTHLGIFAVDRAGFVRAAFDDKVEDLPATIPAILRAMAEGPTPTGTVTPPPSGAAPGAVLSPATAPATPATPTPRAASALPALQIDGRMRVLSASGVRIADTGLSGEQMENGSLCLFRADIRMVWPVARGIDFIPWLRVSDEPEDVLTGGAEQLSNARGTASLRARFDRVSATAGAFPLRISPLLLQRWDAQDAPPLGGVSGCGCGAGASGLKQRSLEVLSPLYTFEGLTGDYTNRPVRFRAFGAVPRWEQAGVRYRQVLGGATADIGFGDGIDPLYELPSPVGLRIGYLDTGDDRRTLPTAMSATDERAGVALGRIGPWRGLSADGEYVGWHRTIATPNRPDDKVDAGGFRAGIRADARRDEIGVWGNLYRLRTDAEFAPQYRALTYSPNQDGWRGAVGVRVFPSSGDLRERVGLIFFARRVQETEILPGEDRRALSTIVSVSLSGRPIADLLAEAHVIQITNESPLQSGTTAKTQGFSFDLRWERIPVLDPVLRLDAIREGVGAPRRHTLWQGYLTLRVLE